MGTAIISGLTFATFLTLVIVPVMYSTFDSISLRVTQAFGGSAEDAAIVSDAVATDSLLDETAGNGAPATDEPSVDESPVGDKPAGDKPAGDGARTDESVSRRDASSDS
jgi:hypothetical protein